MSSYIQSVLFVDDECCLAFENKTEFFQHAQAVHGCDRSIGFTRQNMQFLDGSGYSEIHARITGSSGATFEMVTHSEREKRAAR